MPAISWRRTGASPLAIVFGSYQVEDRDLVISVFERLDAAQADAFLRSVLEDRAGGITY